MKAKKLGKLRYNIWLYFILFALVIVALTWVFQLLLFDTIYQQDKYENLLETGQELSNVLNTDADITPETVNTWIPLAVDANEAGVSTYLARYDEKAQLYIATIFSELSPNYDGSNQDTTEKPIDPIIEGSTQYGGSAKNDPSKESIISSPSISNLINQIITEYEKSGDEFLCDRLNIESDDGYFYFISRVSNPLMSNGYLVLTTSQQSLRETVQVIQLQLVIVTVVVIIASFFLAMYIAFRLSKPIDKMSKTAKSWASGDENVVFVGDNYEELDELAVALNYAKDGIAQTGVLQRDLLANVSHDLKTPLTMIKAYAEMIRDLSGEIKEKRDKHTKVIIDEADRLTMLVNDILDLSKLQNGMSLPDVKTINLSELCSTVIGRFMEFAKVNGYTIITEIEENLLTSCDEQRISQVFYNLIGNSINYTGEDKTIKVKLKKDGNIIRFETIDSGKGISEDKLTTIWDKYYRYSETHQRPIKGTGLGLSIVKTILEEHNLRFGVVSKKDLGSNFFIEFEVQND